MIFKNIVFFGSIKTAKNCLDILIKKIKFEKIFVVTETRSKKHFFVRKYARKKKLLCLNFEEFKNTIKKNKFDIGFSVRYNKIFKVNHIKKFKFGIINLHGGNLPYYRGSNNHIFAIINKEKKFGVTLHFVAKKIDTGRILKIRNFNIKNNETGYSLLNRTFLNGEKLFYNFIQYLNKSKKMPKGKINNKNKGNEYKKKDLIFLKRKLIIKKNKNESKLIQRALYHPKKSYEI